VCVCLGKETMKRPGEDGDQTSKRLREEQQDAFAHDMAQLNAAAMMEAERRQHQQQQQQPQMNAGVVHRIEDSSDESSSHQHNNNSMANNTSMMSDEESILLMEDSRSHRAWLHAPTAGPRRPRVGHDFQVWALPIPPPALTHRPPPQQQQQVNDPDRDTAGTHNHHHNQPAPAQHLESDTVDEDGGGQWLSAQGERHPRIGADYQASLPGPQIR